MSSWHSELPALFVSGESAVHTERWKNAFESFFEDVRVVSANANIPKLTRGNEVVIATPLDTGVKLALSGLLPDICISNGLDMMGDTWAHTFSLIKERKNQFGSFWVDTRWAESVLLDAGIKHVSRVPWGLDRSQLNGLIATAQPLRERALIFPRVGGLHYQPSLAVEVALRALDIGAVDTVEFIDLLPEISKSIRRSEYAGRIKDTPRTDESELIGKIASSSAVVFTPKTDGLSVTLLQSVALGTPVISTPTIGALEVAEILPDAIRIARNSTSESLVKLVEQVITASPQDATSRADSIDWLMKEADQIALVEQALSFSFRSKT